MIEYVINKSKINDFLKELGKSYQVMVPGEVNGVSRFRSFDPESDFNWNYSNTLIPPKEIIFPQNETLFQYQDGEVIEPELGIPDTVIFGVRPCDARSFTMLDKVFCEGNFSDPYYEKKRAACTVISLACNRPGIACFCTSVDGGPDSEKGADIISFDLGEKVLLKPVTGKGNELLKKAGNLEKAGAEDSSRRDELMKSARDRINSQAGFATVSKTLSQAFEAQFWDLFHKKCLGCGICTYLCPTCHCFDITEQTSNEGGKRIRCWDSCQFPLFTLHASGHNPRPTYKERIRQRVMHKFSYCPENFAQKFCTGCGRCVVNCPVNLDIREVVKIIAGETKNE